MKVSVLLVFVLLWSGMKAQNRIFPIELQLLEKYVIEERCDIRELRNKGDYFVGLDVANQNIYAFSKDFKVLKKMGGKGNGPGEYSRITGFDVRNDSIWVIDGIKKKFILANTERKELSTRELSGFVRNGIVFNGNVVYQNSLTASNDFLFTFCNPQGVKQVWDIQNLIKEEFGEGISYIYQGNMCADDEYAVYYCRYSPYFFCFDKNGFKYAQKSIVPVKPPKGTVVKNSMFESVKLSHEYPVQTYGCIYKDDLFLLSKLIFSGEDPNYFTVDVYDVSLGKYRYSLKVPAKNADNFFVMAFLVGRDFLYVLYEDAEIQKFKMQKNG